MTTTDTARPGFDGTLRGLDLFIEVMAYNDLHPQRWDQKSWFATGLQYELLPNPTGDVPGLVPLGELYAMAEAAGVHPCGTAGCIAGNAVLLSDKYEIAVRLYPVGANFDVGGVGVRAVGSESDHTIDFTTAGLDLFELHDAEGLFAAGNSREDVITIAAELFHFSCGHLEDRIADRVDELRRTQTTDA